MGQHEDLAAQVYCAMIASGTIRVDRNRIKDIAKAHDVADSLIKWSPALVITKKVEKVPAKAKPVVKTEPVEEKKTFFKKAASKGSNFAAKKKGAKK
tara:strand:+ start:114 stop:404 length:291 start_codon:yes stop_codon:yes gene_type:complete